MKKTFLSLLFIGIFSVGFAGIANACFLGLGSNCPTHTQPEGESVKANQDKLANTVALPQLTTSLERLNIKKRLEMWNDESKISYIYLINYGRVMSFYTIKGKVTSGSKRLTQGQQVVMADGTPCDNWTSNDCFVKDSPELDGTYGSSNPYIFFWTTDGVYVQWSGDYMLVDQPLQLTTTPELVRNVK